MPIGERGAFYNWVDKNHKNAWTIGAERLDEATIRFIETQDEFEMQREIRTYFNTLVAFANEYKKQTGKNNTGLFLESMNEKQRRT